MPLAAAAGAGGGKVWGGVLEPDRARERAAPATRPLAPLACPMLTRPARTPCPTRGAQDRQCPADAKQQCEASEAHGFTSVILKREKQLGQSHAQRHSQEFASPSPHARRLFAEAAGNASEPAGGEAEPVCDGITQIVWKVCGNRPGYAPAVTNDTVEEVSARRGCGRGRAAACRHCGPRVAGSLARQRRRCWAVQPDGPPAAEGAGARLPLDRCRARRRRRFPSSRTPFPRPSPTPAHAHAAPPALSAKSTDPHVSVPHRRRAHPGWDHRAGAVDAQAQVRALTRRHAAPRQPPACGAASPGATALRARTSPSFHPCPALMLSNQNPNRPVRTWHRMADSEDEDPRMEIARAARLELEQQQPGSAPAQPAAAAAAAAKGAAVELQPARGAGSVAGDVEAGAGGDKNGGRAAAAAKGARPAHAAHDGGESSSEEEEEEAGEGAEGDGGGEGGARSLDADFAVQGYSPREWGGRADKLRVSALRIYAGRRDTGSSPCTRPQLPCPCVPRGVQPGFLPARLESARSAASSSGSTNRAARCNRSLSALDPRACSWCWSR